MGLGETLRSFIDPYEDEAFENDEEQQQGRRLGALDENQRLAATSRQHCTFVRITPADFDDVQEIADHLKADTPVIIDLGSCEDDLVRRLLDFCSGLTYALGRLLVSAPFFSLPNLIADRRVVPEFIQPDPGEVARAAAELIGDGPARNAQLKGLDEVRRTIGEPGASKRAAGHVLELLRDVGGGDA